MITILETPSKVSPVYNPIYIKAQSNNTTEEAFMFLFDLYVNGTFVNRDRLLPRPGTIESIYSPARVLESYLSYDLSHNVTTETASINCMDSYTVRVGEEYVEYWSFNDTIFDSFTSTSFTVLESTNIHSFVIGDSITIVDTVYGGYNGVHTVEDVIDNYKVLINKTFVVTPVNPGRATWADKRKSEFITYEQLVNPEMLIADGNWTSYGPDAGGNVSELDVSDTLIFKLSDVSYIDYVTSTGGTIAPLVPGQLYSVTFTVSNVTNPSNTPDQYVQANVGGTFGMKRVGTGTWTEVIQCGIGTNFALNLSFIGANTGVGTHQVTIKEAFVDGSVVGFDFNGVLQYEQVPTWDYTEYKLDGSTKRFLTNQPSTVKTKFEDRGSIGFMNIVDINLGYNYSLVVNSTADNILINSLEIPLTIMGVNTQPNSRILEVPAYPWNLNQWSQTLFATDVITTSDISYTLHIIGEDPSTLIKYTVSETKRFEIDNCGTKYEPVRFMFLNSLGQFDYFNATLLSRTTLNTTRESFTKTLDYNYSVGDRGKTIINVNSQEAYTVNTDWVSQETAHWLTYEFFNSTEHYVLDNTTGTIIPIVLDTSSIEDKKRVNDKLLNYQFNYSKALPINTQRN